MQSAPQSIPAPEVKSRAEVKNVQEKPVVPPQKSTLMLANTTLVGTKGAIELKDAQQQVAKLWEKFSQMSALQNNIDWSKSSIVVYAYYHNFNQDFSWADLMIGYDLAALKVSSNAPQLTIKQGPYHKYRFSTQNQSASDEAWAQAYIHKNIVERHTLNPQGELVGTDVIVLQR